MKCEIGECWMKSIIIYYGHNVCSRCWALHCSGQLDLKKILKQGQFEAPSFSAPLIVSTGV